MATPTDPLPMPVYTADVMAIEDEYPMGIAALLGTVRGIVWQALDVDTFGDYGNIRDLYRGKSLEQLVLDFDTAASVIMRMPNGEKLWRNLQTGASYQGGMMLAATLSNWFYARDTSDTDKLADVSGVLADEYGLQFGIAPA